MACKVYNIKYTIPRIKWDDRIGKKKDPPHGFTRLIAKMGPPN